MSYEVGYGKPPKENQFPKGQSGNPKGRPSASARDSGESPELLRVVSKVKRRKVSVTRGGKAVKISGEEALVNQTLNDALRGDAKAREQFFKLSEKADLAALAGRTSEPLHIIVTGGLPDD